MRVLENKEHKGLEVYFDSKPEQKIIDALKSGFFKWHTVKKCWFAKDNEKTQRIIENIRGGGVLDIAPIKTRAKKVEKVKNKYGVKVGDIFAMSWGYEQTNVDFFQVVELKGQTMVKIKEIAGTETRQDSAMSGHIKPVKNSFLKSSQFTNDKTLENTQNNEGVVKKIGQLRDGTLYINMTSYANAYLTSEDAEHFTSSWY